MRCMVCRRRGKRRCAPRLAWMEGVLLLDIDRGLALRPGELNSLVSNVPSCRCRLAAVTDSLFWLNVLCPAHDPFPLDFVSLC